MSPTPIPPPQHTALLYLSQCVIPVQGTSSAVHVVSCLMLACMFRLIPANCQHKKVPHLHPQAIASKLGKSSPALGDVAAAAGCHVSLAATSLARRAPVYLSSSSHPDMLVRDALRASCAIPFFFTPVRDAASQDLLVDGCISDCTPLAGKRWGGGEHN